MTEDDRLYRAQVASALTGAKVIDSSTYVWLGRRSRPVAAAIDAELDEPRRRRRLVASLREELYASFYCPGRPVEARSGEPEPTSPDPWLLMELAEANAGRGSWEPGWTVVRLDDDEVVVEKDGLRARAAVADCRGGDEAIGPGAALSLRLPKELPQLSPGFYTVVGDTPSSSPSGAVVRVYWNVDATVASALVHALVSRLNAATVPFRLKVGDHPFRLDRCDAAVLYLDELAYRRADGTISDVAGALAGRLLPQVPAFTLPYAPGVALAEDDGDGESFGTRLCGLLADGIVTMHERRVADPDAQLDAVADRFAAAGVDIDAPYLAPSLVGRHVL